MSYSVSNNTGKTIRVGFLGYGTRALDALMEHDGFEVRLFVAPQSRLCSDVYDARIKYPDIDFIIARNNEDLAGIFDRYSGEVDCFLMNACPIILNRDVLNIIPVYNIHPGDLSINRGHQPHLWTVLLGEKNSEIVLHSVTPNIDEGDIIAMYRCDVTEDMDSLDVLDLLEDHIPDLLDGLYDHIVNNAPPLDHVVGGDYRRVMVHSDYEFKAGDIDKPGFKEDVLRKIRARAMHHGAFFMNGDQRIYVDRLLFDESIDPVSDDPSDVRVSIHGTVVFIEKGDRRFVFNVNKKERV